MYTIPRRCDPRSEQRLGHVFHERVRISLRDEEKHQRKRDKSVERQSAYDRENIKA